MCLKKERLYLGSLSCIASLGARVWSDRCYNWISWHSWQHTSRLCDHVTVPRYSGATVGSVKLWGYDGKKSQKAEFQNFFTLFPEKKKQRTFGPAAFRYLLCLFLTGFLFTGLWSVLMLTLVKHRAISSPSLPLKSESHWPTCIKVTVRPRRKIIGEKKCFFFFFKWFQSGGIKVLHMMHTDISPRNEVKHFKICKYFKTCL